MLPITLQAYSLRASIETRTRNCRLEVYYVANYTIDACCGSSRTRTYTLRRDQIYSLASQPIAQYFQIGLYTLQMNLTLYNHWDKDEIRTHKKQFCRLLLSPFSHLVFAILEGLEPSTSDLTGLRSTIELQYHFVEIRRLALRAARCKPTVFAW